MIIKNLKINWYLFVAGILFLGAGFFHVKTIQPADLIKITVQLSEDITIMKGDRGAIDYKIRIKEYKNQFNILKGSISGGKHQPIAELESGQWIELLISKSDEQYLSRGEQEINILGIALNGNMLMSAEEFYYNQNMYQLRLAVFSFVAALLLLLNSLILIPAKINYILVGTTVGIVIIFRIFQIVIY